jgi:hypothetical protein
MSYRVGWIKNVSYYGFGSEKVEKGLRSVRRGCEPEYQGIISGGKIWSQSERKRCKRQLSGGDLLGN